MFSRTTAAPAEPVKPDTNTLLLQQSGGYSLMCGSSDGTMYASTLAAFISLRMAASVAAGSSDSRLGLVIALLSSSGTGCSANVDSVAIARTGAMRSFCVYAEFVRLLIVLLRD